jgi:hypothetical protein
LPTLLTSPVFMRCSAGAHTQHSMQLPPTFAGTLSNGESVEVLLPEQKRRMAELVGWIVRLYEATDQPEKAWMWRERVSRGPRLGPK